MDVQVGWKGHELEETETIPCTVAAQQLNV